MLKKWMTILWFGAVFLMVSEASYAEQPVKATWIWQSDLVEREGGEVIAFSQAHEVNLIYLRVDRQRPPEAYRSFVQHAREAGIEVHAVGGHPAWALEAHQPHIQELVQWVRQYNEAVEDTAHISGIQLSVSPFLLPEWDRQQRMILQSWLVNMEQFLRDVPPQLETSVTLPFWFDRIQVPGSSEGTVQDWVLDRFDHVVLLAYRDRAEGSDGILSVSQPGLSRADVAGGNIVVAVNTKPEQMPHVTVRGQGMAGMIEQLNRVESELADRPSYAGMAIHDYVYWHEMASEQASDERDGHIYGTYIWHAERLISEPDDILAFAQEKRLNLIYARLDLTQPYSAYREFVQKAKAEGIEVHALGGHPKWATLEHRPYLERLIRYVKGFNTDQDASLQFDGIHLDIEPYVMPEWYTDQERILQEWMDNIRYFVKEAKRDTDLEASADMAMWFDDLPTPGQPELFFNEWMIQQLDHVTVMAFRDHLDGPGGIVAMTQTELEYADKHGKDLMIAVEMKNIPETPFISYYEEGEAEMIRQRDQLQQRLASYDAYKGHVVHAYEYWKEAKE